MSAAEVRHGERVLPLVDPHGLRLALVETSDARDFSPWVRSTVPEQNQVKGLHAVRIRERDATATVDFLTNVLGF